MTRPVKTPEQANANWSARMADQTTQQKFVQGVQSVTESPNAKAASPAAQQKYMNATQNAVTSGRMAARNQAVGVDKWKQATAAGAQAMAAGAARKKQKQLDAARRLSAGWQAARDAAAAIPHDGSTQAALAKVAASITAMKAAAGKPTS